MVSEHVQVLTPKQVSKPWGRKNLPPPFCDAGDEPVGEIWFEHAEGSLDLLVKYLFTTENLSISVHPDDELAIAKGLSSGKDESWVLLDAEPGAVLGIGTNRVLSRDELHRAAIDGSLDQLVDWRPVSRGDYFYVPAGTVHAIGAGITLVEVQQPTDINYRLYDFDRPRKLHLEEGIEAATAEPYSEALAGRIDFSEPCQLFDGPKFSLWFGCDWPSQGLTTRSAYIIPLTGSVSVDGVKGAAGECLICPPNAELETTENAELLIAQAC